MTERRILVHAPRGQDAMLALKVLAGAGMEAVSCPGETELRAEMDRGVGAILAVEEALATTAMRPLVEFLEKQPAWSDLPVLVLSKYGADSPEVQRAMRTLGNVSLLERPVRTMALVSAARSALRSREHQYQVRALNRAKDDFLATLAHELRNPLAPIRNAINILERKYPEPDVTRLTRMVDRQVSHLKRLVDDLLDIARITSGKLELQLGAVPLGAVVQHAVEMVDASVREKGHRLEVRQPTGSHVLVCDKVRLVQMLANLLVNACKFTPPGGFIELDVTVEGRVAQFVVRDSGEGIPADSLERIFDMFAQARVVGEPTGGLGIGLHLAKAFTELHGGTLVARSPGPGQGSEFVLRLPVVMGTETEVTADGAAAPIQSALPRKVLVVDDNVDAAVTLEALLRMQGITVSLAHDGAQAVAAVHRDKPEAVVMDIGMPVMNGYEAARRIRGDFGERAPRLIALTGWGQFLDKTRARDAGFNHHFVKPLDFEALISCLAGERAERQP